MLFEKVISVAFYFIILNDMQCFFISSLSIWYSLSIYNSPNINSIPFGVRPSINTRGSEYKYTISIYSSLLDEICSVISSFCFFKIPGIFGKPTEILWDVLLSVCDFCKLKKTKYLHGETRQSAANGNNQFETQSRPWPGKL